MGVDTTIIVADKYRAEIGELNINKSLDIDLGADNDFELVLSLDDWESKKYGDEFMIYIPETEYGGYAKNSVIDTTDNNNTITFTGFTWRGMLEKKIVEPPSGLAYRTVTGDANTAISTIIGSQLDPLFVVDTAASGFTVNYQFDRYTDMLTGLTKMLKTVGAKLLINFSRTDRLVHLSAVAIIDYSETLEYDSNNNTYFIISVERNRCNHLIGLGSGELSARQVVHRYVGEDGEVTTTKFYTEADEIVEVYDYPNAEDLAILTSSTEEKLKELKNKKATVVKVENVPAEIGDIVGGRERISGYVVKKPITGKIYRISGTTENIELKVGD